MFWSHCEQIPSSVQTIVVLIVFPTILTNPGQIFCFIYAIQFMLERYDEMLGVGKSPQFEVINVI